MNNDFSLSALIKVLFEWKRAIGLTVLAVGILTAVITLLQPNYYKSETVFYAANPDLADPSPLGYSSDMTYIYGGGQDLDRLFSIVMAPEMEDYLIKKFNLFKHYNYDSSTVEGRFKMRQAFKNNYNVVKSKYDAIVLSIEDTDRILAAQMANEARNRCEYIAQQLIKKAQNKLLSSYTSNVAQQSEIVTRLIDSLKLVKSQFQIIEPAYQARAYSDEIVKAHGNLAEAKARANYYKGIESKQDSTIKYQAIAAGLASKIFELENKLHVFNKGVNEFRSLDQEYGRASDQTSINKEKVKLLQSSFENDFTAIHVISQAYPAEHKSRPKRAIIVLSSMMIALLTSMLGILMINSFKTKVQSV